MEEFVPYDQSLQLREIGFDYPCLMVYANNNQQLLSCVYSFMTPSIQQVSNQDRESNIKAPLWQQAFNWFREQHNLEPDVYWNSSGYYVLFCYDKSTLQSAVSHVSLARNVNYYNAQLDLLNRLIEIVNNKLKQN